MEVVQWQKTYFDRNDLVMFFIFRTLSNQMTQLMMRSHESIQLKALLSGVKNISFHVPPMILIKLLI
jgi:hypothetical protein